MRVHVFAARAGDSTFRSALSAAMQCMPYGASRTQFVRTVVPRARLSVAVTETRHDRHRIALSTRIRTRPGGGKPPVLARRCAADQLGLRQNQRVRALQLRSGRRSVGGLLGVPGDVQFVYEIALSRRSFRTSAGAVARTAAG